MNSWQERCLFNCQKLELPVQSFAPVHVAARAGSCCIQWSAPLHSLAVVVVLTRAIVLLRPQRRFLSLLPASNL